MPILRNFLLLKNMFDSLFNFYHSSYVKGQSALIGAQSVKSLVVVFPFSYSRVIELAHEALSPSLKPTYALRVDPHYGV